jgi:hypothetical protein
MLRCMRVSYKFSELFPGPMRRGFSQYIGPGPREPRRGFWISEWPHSLSHRRFILIFFNLFWYFQLFLVYLEKSLCKIHLDIWWKFTSGFIGPQILNFERSPSLFPGPQRSLVSSCKISLGGRFPLILPRVKNVEQSDLINNYHDIVCITYIYMLSFI